MGQSRNENILENMLGASNPLGEPRSREEALLMQLLTIPTVEFRFFRTKS